MMEEHKESKEHPGYHEWAVERNMHQLFGPEEVVEYGDCWETNWIGDEDDEEAQFHSEGEVVRDFLGDGQPLTFYAYDPEQGEVILSSLWSIPDEEWNVHGLVMEENPFFNRRYYCFFMDDDATYVLLGDIDGPCYSFHRRKLIEPRQEGVY